MTIDMRGATEEDLPAIVQVERSAFSDPWSARSFRDALRHPAVYFACACDDRAQLLGYVVAWFVADEGEVANLAVAPWAWGRGVGRALLDAALREAELRETSAMYLEVRASNERAQRLYESRGFEVVGRRAEYYRKPVEDAILLRRVMTRMCEVD